MNNASNRVYDSTFQDSIKYPMESSSYLLSFEPIGPRFDVKDDRQFITDSHLSIYNRIDLLNIMSLLATFAINGEFKNCTKVLPTLKKLQKELVYRLCIVYVRKLLDMVWIPSVHQF
jgi:hypothetical protein